MGNGKYLHIRAYLLHEHWAIFHVLESYSTNQIPFRHIGLRSITCHFLVNNLHFITHSNCIVQPTEKNSHGTKCYWYWVFHAILSRWCSIYLHLFEIAINLWLGSIRGTTEFQFAFRNKITRNYIFEVTNCKRIILIISLLCEFS